MNRLRKIEKMRWELDAEIPPEIIANMSHLEGQFLISYDKALSQYMDDIGLDLTIVTSYLVSSKYHRITNNLQKNLSLLCECYKTVS